MQPYLDGRYARDNPGWHAEDAPHKARAVHAVLTRLGWRRGLILDVGCGTGDVLRELASLGGAADEPPRWEGWDPFAPLRPETRGVRLVPRDPLRERPPADVALCLDVLEHLEAPGPALEALVAIAPRVVLRIPLEVSLRDVLRPAAALEARRRYGHLHHWSRATALAMLQERGLTPVDVGLDRVPVAPASPTGWPTEIARRLAARAGATRAADLLGGFSVIVAAVAERPGGNRVDGG